MVAPPPAAPRPAPTPQRTPAPVAQRQTPAPAGTPAGPTAQQIAQHRARTQGSNQTDAAMNTEVAVVDFSPARLVDRGLEITEADGTTRDRTAAERFELPELSDAERSFTPVLLYFYLQEDPDDRSTRHPACQRFEKKVLEGQDDLAAAADRCIRIEIDARQVPRMFLKMWKVSQAPALYVLDHTGKPRFRFTSASTSPRAVQSAIEKVLAHAANESARDANE